MSRALSVGVGVGASLWLAAVLRVHLRGRVRHRLARQLFDQSAFLAPYNVLMYAFSAVSCRPFLDARELPALGPLREAWRTIRAEGERLLEEGWVRPATAHDDIAFNTFFRRGWTRFHLKWYGTPLPSARRLCPRTVALLESIPEVNAALFAVLPPGGRLGAHRDPFAGSLRYHLGLRTPNSEACRIEVDGVPYAWRDGEDVVFDETYVHSARNDSDTPRLILFCDVARPLRTGPVRALNRLVTRYVVGVTAARNVAGEPLGVVNRVAPAVYAAREFFHGLKKLLGRRAYYGVKYALLGVGVVGLAAAFLRGL